MEYLVAILIGYFFGSIPFSLIIGKLFYKKDIRKEGSGNLGATNAGRVLGKRFGVFILILDQLKTVLAVLLIYFLFKENLFLLYITGLFTVIGHCYPVFASFKGGKGVDCAFGFLLVTNLALYFIAISIFILSLYKTKMVSISSMSSVLFTAIISFVSVFHVSLPLFIQLDYYYSLTLILVSVLIIYRHKSNIEKVLNKNENKVKWL